MPSTIEICNRALSTYLGVSRITSLSETNPKAQACNEHYAGVVRSCLERHEWNFATARQALAETTNDRTEWAYRYARPADALKLRWVNDPAVARAALAMGQSPDSAREVAGLFIYSDVPYAVAEFTANLTDPTLFPQSFADAVSAALASAIAIQLSDSVPKAQNASDAANDLLNIAMALDAQNAPPANIWRAADYHIVRGIS